MGWINLSTTQYHLCYATHGSWNNTLVKSKASLIDCKKINIKLRKESFYASHMYSFCHDVAFEDMGSATADDNNPFAGLEEDDEDAI